MRVLRVLSWCATVVLLTVACSNSSDATMLTDCEYSDKVQKIIDTFQRNVGTAVAELTKDTAASTENDDAKRAITALDRELGTAIADLRKLKIDGDIRNVNGELVGGLTDLRARLPDATRAAEAGDLTRVEAILDEAGIAFGNRFDGLDQRHPAATARLAKCQ